MNKYNIIKQAFLDQLINKYNIPVEMGELMFRDELLKIAMLLK